MGPLQLSQGFLSRQQERTACQGGILINIRIINIFNSKVIKIRMINIKVLKIRMINIINIMVINIINLRMINIINIRIINIRMIDIINIKVIAFIEMRMINITKVHGSRRDVSSCEICQGALQEDKRDRKTGQFFVPRIYLQDRVWIFFDKRLHRMRAKYAPINIFTYL